MDNEKDLPKGLSIVHNKSSTVFEIRFRKNGHQFRRRLPPNTKRPEAIKILQNINSQKNTKKLDNMLITLPQKAAKDFGSNYPDIDKKIQKMLSRSKARAKKKGMEHTITPSVVMKKLLASGGRCQVTGTPLVYDRSSEYRANPFQPSIDRIDSSNGYTSENIRIVCYGVNMAMSEWGEEIFSIFAKNYVLKRMDKI